MIKTEQCMCIPLERGGLAMKKRSITVLIIAGLLSALLSGCQTGPGASGETPGNASGAGSSAVGEMNGRGWKRRGSWRHGRGRKRRGTRQLGRSAFRPSVPVPPHLRNRPIGISGL